MDALPDRPPPARPLGEVVSAWVRWVGAGRLIVTAIAVVAVVAGGYWLLRTPAAPVEDRLPFASAAPPPASAPLAAAGAGAGSTAGSTVLAAPIAAPAAVASPIVVYVTGAVVSAGVYELPAGARVQQAVEAAGGASADADADAINLAARLDDGVRIFVPRVGQAVPAVVTPVGPTGVAGAAPGQAPIPDVPLDLNVATADQLDLLPGIGPATAAAIVTRRETNGPYASVDDLLDVRGIGAAKLDAIRDLVRA